ncbi:MAG: cytochrome c [Calditrichota bacterium]
MLSSELHYERLAAQKELIHRQVNEVKALIEDIALNAENPYGQLHALWTLEGLNALDAALWQKATEISNAPVVHETLIRFSAFFPEDESNQLSYFQKVAALENRQVNQQLALRLGGMKTPGANKLLLELASRYGNDAVLAEAFISGIHNREAGFLQRIRSLHGTDSLRNFLQVTLANAESQSIQTPQLPKAFYKDNRTAGFELYQLHCAGCHGMDGKGIDNMVPPLLDSEFVGGSLDRLILLTLNGLKGPLTVNGKRYNMNAEMPGIKNNPALSDEDITALLIFTRNSFSFANPWFPVEKVTKWREATKGRTELYGRGAGSLLENGRAGESALRA